jgi:hypothetical protein
VIDGRSNRCPNCGRSRSSMRHQTKCLGKNRTTVRRARRNSRQTFSKVSGALVMSVTPASSLGNGDYCADYNAALKATEPAGAGA